MEMEKDQGLRAPPASQDRVTDERSPEDGSPPSGSVPTGAVPFTPGPWCMVRRVCEDAEIWAQGESEDRLIARVCEADRENLPDVLLIAAAPDQNAALVEARVALSHAASTFYRYARLHRDKCTDEGDAKACANASMGEEMNAAIEVVDAALIKAGGEA